MADTVPVPQDWSDREAVAAWLRTQSRALCTTLTARTVLRALPPVIDPIQKGDRERWRVPVLAMLRSTAGLWLQAVAPSRAAEATSDFTAASYAESIATALVAFAHEYSTNGVAQFHAADATDASAGSSGLAQAKLWPDGTPKWAGEAWSRVRDHLLAADEGWEVWTTWYDARLRGDPVDIELETRRVIEPTRWDEGPAAVNAEIAAIIADHEARKAQAHPRPTPETEAAATSRMLAAPVLHTAYADFAVDPATATVGMVPMQGDTPVLDDATLSLDWRSRLDGLSIQPLALIDDIRDAGCNVPRALLNDLGRYGREAERGPDGVRPGVLDAYGQNLVAAGETEDIVAALGDYLGGTLRRIGTNHTRLMRDYHAQVTSRLHAAPVTLPEDATPAAVADAVEAISESLKHEAWGGLRATRDVSDLLDERKDVFRAAAARIDRTGDAAQRKAILDSIRADQQSTLALIARLVLRVRQHVGSNSPFAHRVGYAASLTSLLEAILSGAIVRRILTILRWLGVG